MTSHHPDQGDLVRTMMGWAWYQCAAFSEDTTDNLVGNIVDDGRDPGVVGDTAH